MHLIEIFLPTADNEGARFPQSLFDSVEQQLTERFGGVTSYPRAPASGLWKTSPSNKQEDDLIIYEVMTEELDEIWWKIYREDLEKIFRQEKLIIRTQITRLL
jgi:hypothetical protein